MRIWITPGAVLNLSPDDLDWLLWEYTCFPFCGWKEQLAGYAIHGVPESAWQKHEEMTQAIIDHMGGDLVRG